MYVCQKFYTLINVLNLQLDAYFLDQELESLLLNQLERSLSRISALNRILSRFHPELVLLLRSFLFTKSVYEKSASPAQKLLSLKLYSHDYGTASRGQLTAFGVLTCAFPYLGTRFGPKFLHYYSMLETALGLSRILNTLLFFINGTYGSVEQRLSGITCAYESNKAAFTTESSEHVAREILWHSFEEFLTFVLPLINPVKLKNLWLGVTGTKVHAIPAPKTTTVEWHTCAICQKPPVNARQIGCDHCFCYYCVMSTYLADESNGFTCPVCRFTVTEKSCIREIYRW